MKIFLVSIALMLAVCMCSDAADLAFYSGLPNDGWYVPDQMLADVETMKAVFSGTFSSVSAYKDDALNGLKSWTEANMTDGEMDILWLNGCMPSVLYPNPNLQRDGSLAEQWLDEGNMIINVADWFGYCTYETGVRGSDNGGAGAESILDLPGIIRSADNTNITITAAGKKYLPSLGNSIITDRPVPKTAVVAPWEIAEIFGENGNDTDPVVIHNTETDGYIAFINQANSGHAEDRAQATIEFIENWAIGTEVLVAVEPQAKLSTTWGALKR